MPPEPIVSRSRDLRILGRLRPYLLAHAGLLAASGAMLPVLAAAQLLPPYLVRVAIDRHVVPAADGDLDALGGLWWIVGAYLALQVGEGVLRFAQIYVMQLAGQRIMHDLRSSVFRHVQRQSLSFFDRNPIGQIMTRVTSDVETLNELVSQGVVAMARDFVVLVAIVGVMLWIDVRLALASFVVFPALVVIVSLFRGRLRDTYDAARTRVARLNAFLQETITGMEVVQAFAQEDRNAQRFGRRRSELLRAELRSVRYSSWLSASVQAATTVATALVLAYGGFGIIGSTVTVGILVQFLEYLRRFYQPIEDLSDKYDALQRAAAASKKIFGMLDVEPDIVPPAVPVPISRGAGEIRFEGVTFTYPSAPDGASPVIRDVDLRIRDGEKVALVGATGAGKSSLVKLVKRYYEPQAGRITLGGVDIRDFDPSDLRRRLATVPQEVFLFTDTVAENIGLSAAGVSRQEVEESARVAEADSFIRELPSGYDTTLGERGATLSFGERQLLAFARALVSDPVVLILDEATSSVDSETEACIQRALRRLLADRTALIIAHRLSTIREVDRIVVMHHGEVREQGSHRELLEHGGLYATLYRLQYEQDERDTVSA